jgi:putative redox protein
MTTPAHSTSSTVTLDWLSEKTFLLRDRNGFPVLMAQPGGVNAADLLPLSLIGCAAWDVVAILHKQRQQLESLQIGAESIRAPDPPWRVHKIIVSYRLAGRDLDAAKVQRAIDLTERKYCSVYATLSLCVEIESRFEIFPAGSNESGSTGL